MPPEFLVSNIDRCLKTSFSLNSVRENDVRTRFFKEGIVCAHSPSKTLSAETKPTLF